MLVTIIKSRYICIVNHQHMFVVMKLSINQSKYIEYEKEIYLYRLWLYL